MPERGSAPGAGPFDDTAVSLALGHWDLRRDEVSLLGGGENRVYGFARGGAAYVLRLTPVARRSPAQVRAELDFVQKLAASGLRVARPVALDGGDPLRVVGAPGTRLLAVAFERAPGRSVERERWPPDLVHAWGRTAGRMHAVARTHRPEAGAARRPHWHEEERFDAARFLPASRAGVREHCEALVRELKAWQRSDDAYGLVHADLGAENFRVDGLELTVYDFDDCMYGWFAHDIATTLFTALQSPHAAADPSGFARAFLRDFRSGYAAENSLAPHWWRRIPLLLELQRIERFITLHRSGARSAAEREERERLGRAIQAQRDWIDLGSL